MVRQLIFGALGMGVIAGCHPRTAGISPQADERAAGTTNRSNHALSTGQACAPATDPMQYLRGVLRRAAALEQYQVTFVRQERLGLIPSLHEVERINAWFRARPFSVKFEWQGDNSEFREAAYVEGANKGKVLLLRRSGLLGLPPGVERYDPEDSVKFGKTRNPVTDFGVNRMMERTLNRLEGAKAFGGAKLHYMGMESLEGVRAYHLRAEYPRDDPFPNKRQDLYIDVASDLPVGVYLWLPNGDLDAMYLYLNRREPEAPLADETFTIRRSGKHGKSAKGS